MYDKNIFGYSWDNEITSNIMPEKFTDDHANTSLSLFDFFKSKQTTSEGF